MATNPGRARAAMGMTRSSPAAAEPAGTEVELVENRIAKIRRMETQFQDAMPRGFEAKMLVRDAMTAVRQTPKLAETWEPSFWGALMTSAQLGLRPNVGSLGHGWVLPFYSSKNRRQEAQWILGYQGMTELAWRSKLVSEIYAHTVYENEHWKITLGGEKNIEHEPMLKHADRGDPILHYAVMRMVNGGKIWTYVTEEDIEETIKRSETGKRGFGPWIDDRGPMSRKTAVRQLWRFSPKSTEMSLAAATDDTVQVFDGADVVEQQEAEAVQERERITVTRADAEQQPAEPDAAPVARVKQAPSRAREAALDALEQQFGARWVIAVESTIGSAVLADDEPDADNAVRLDMVTLDELRTALGFDFQAFDDAALDEAADKDGK